MEIKAVLEKIFSEREKLDFIVVNNHQKGYEIRETETALEAWGKDGIELLEDAKSLKYLENEQKRETFLTSGVTYKDILWDSDIEQKLNISVQVNSMDDQDVVTWVAMDGITSMECTKADLLAIGQLLTQMTAYVWQYKNPYYKVAIAEAQTMEELSAIEIIYDFNEINEAENELSE